MTVLDGLAAQLAADGFGDYQPDQPYTAGQVGIVVGPVPAAPGQVIGVTRYTAADDDDVLGYDRPNVALRVRGDADVRTSQGRAQGIYDRYVGARRLTLPDGTYVVLIVGLQGGPLDAGRDPAGRHTHTVNLSVLYLNPTPHRP